MAHVVYDSILGAVSLRQVRSSGFRVNAKTGEGRAAGSTAPAELYFLEGQPMADLTTGDLAGVIAGFSLTGGLLVSAGSIVLPYNQRKNGGTFEAGASHFTLSGANGLIVPQSFEGAQGDEDGAGATLGVHFISTDGLTAPVAANVNQSLAASAFNKLYEFGPCGINGAQLGQVKSSRVETGTEISKELFDGDNFPRNIFIDAENIKPKITLTFANLNALGTLGAIFASLSSVSVHYRKRVDGGTTASGANHVRFSLAGSLSVVESVSGQNRQTGEAQLTIEGKVLTASAASAVSF